MQYFPDLNRRVTLPIVYGTSRNLHIQVICKFMMTSILCIAFMRMVHLQCVTYYDLNYTSSHNNILLTTIRVYITISVYNTVNIKSILARGNL